MRIVGGKFKGLNLATPADQATRPTSDRVREAIFNILAHGIAGLELDGARVLDLFAGTGALGFEALSRGGRHCQFVDESAEARGLVRTNADKLGVIGQCKIWRRDATDLGLCAPVAKFDLVFCDPPYDKGLGVKALQALVQGLWLNDGAIVVLEEINKAEVQEIAGLTLIDERDYGETKVRFYRFGSAPAE
jgi:16S rRNA (guanine966-N2)-methyltransferase